MDQLLNIIKQTRTNFIQLLNNSTLEELNAVPSGFNNNIIWNFGHIISSQQLLCYRLAGLPMMIKQEYILQFQKGTRPEQFVGAEEVQDLKELMLTTIDQLAEDLKQNVFVNYHAFTTEFGVRLNSTAEAVQFFGIHDGYHYGCAASIKKVITNKI
ncbi:DinB family protein [Pedobacter sp. MC2016-24]|uniref:DinB family protein n=1 Tax=Pedobacter sp. MC2016-24 TaxID=2780090 RepID=UPI0018822B0F|nr:DinB family protein [Pedobacter sp. MC2016-24]MBE9602467.1 DinB family protein [Pedobacter sp. MC2016-24]